MSRQRCLMLMGLAALAVTGVVAGCEQEREPAPLPTPATFVAQDPVPVQVLGPQLLPRARWVRCFRGPDGVIYFRNGKQSVDGGRTITDQRRLDIEDLVIRDTRAFLVSGDSLYVAGNRARLVARGEYEIDVWRSDDAMESLEASTARLSLPPGPTREPDPGEWYGVFVHRSIVDLGDGVWLMTMYGNFEADTIEPKEASARSETTYLGRSFVVRSTDRGETWDYLATIAAPVAGAPIGEGFVEPTMVRLADGRLLCVMRTGHLFPLHASWSDDRGETWSDPVYTGLDRGCDPCLIRLADDRIALSWGRRFPEGWSRISERPDHERWEYPGAGHLNLSLSDDGGRTWSTRKIARGTGSCYSTLIEVAPDTLLCQVDPWVWRLAIGD